MDMKPKKGVLLVQLGTPDSIDVKDVKRYLNEFLMDPRVMDIPYLNRFLLIRGIITPRRAPETARVYSTIWDPETGSPLMYYSEEQQRLLQEELGDEYHVELAMRYQNPSIESALKKMEGMWLESIRVIPLFPQYASATSGSVIDKVMEIMRNWQYFPEVSFVSNFHDEPDMIDVFVENAHKHDLSHFDHFLFSYHGLPVRQLGKVDPSGELQCPEFGCDSCQKESKAHCYLSHCYGTTRLLVEKLGLKEGDYTVCFQSRLGKTPWIQPYTSDVLERLAKEGKKKLLVFSPAFVADCIETIDEIEVEYADEFKAMGGEEVKLVESLNLNPKWIQLLKKLALGK